MYVVYVELKPHNALLLRGENIGIIWLFNVLQDFTTTNFYIYFTNFFSNIVLNHCVMRIKSMSAMTTYIICSTSARHGKVKLSIPGPDRGSLVSVPDARPKLHHRKRH